MTLAPTSIDEANVLFDAAFDQFMDLHSFLIAALLFGNIRAFQISLSLEIPAACKQSLQQATLS